MIRDGQWRNREDGISLEQYIFERHPRKIGFHLPAWYSPWITWGQCASEFLSSKDFPEKLMNFRNSWEAEPCIEKYETKSEQQLLQNTIDIDPLTIPKGSVALTCGIDPSGDGFYFSVLAWKPNMSPHLVHYGFLPTWGDVTSLIWENHYEIEGGGRLPIWRAAIDTGGGKMEDRDLSMTEEAYDWLRKYGRGRCFGTKGMSHLSTHKIKISKIDKTPKGQPILGGIVLLNLDTDSFKNAIHYRLQVKEGDPGRFTFHREVGNDFISHLLAEEKRVNFRTGQSEWVRIRKANHYLDCTISAYAVADPELFGGVMVVRLRARESTQTPQTKITDPFRQGVQDGWPTGPGGRRSWAQNCRW